MIIAKNILEPALSNYNLCVGYIYLRRPVYISSNSSKAFGRLGLAGTRPTRIFPPSSSAPRVAAAAAGTHHGPRNAHVAAPLRQNNRWVIILFIMDAGHKPSRKSPLWQGTEPAGHLGSPKWLVGPHSIYSGQLLSIAKK